MQLIDLVQPFRSAFLLAIPTVTASLIRTNAPSQRYASERMQIVNSWWLADTAFHCAPAFAARPRQRTAVTGVFTAATALARRSASRCANRYATSEPATASSIGTRLS